MKNILLVNDTSLTLHYGCDLLMMNIYNLLEKNNINLIGSIYHEEKIIVSNNNLNKIKKSDVILINGEGTLHRKKNSDQIKVDEIINFISHVKRTFKKKVIIFNATFAKLNSNDFKILKLVDKIFVRENISKKYLKLNKLDSVFLPDLTLLSKNSRLHKSFALVTTDSSVKGFNQKLIKFSKIYKSQYYKMLHHSGFDKISKLIVLQIYKMFPSCKIDKLFIFFKRDLAKKFFKEISKSKFILTGRFHCICFCIVNYIPFFSLAGDTHKVSGLLEDVRMQNRLLENRSLLKSNLNFKNFSINEKKQISKILKLTKLRSKLLIKIIKR